MLFNIKHGQTLYRAGFISDQTLTGSGLISDQTLYRAGFISDQTLTGSGLISDQTLYRAGFISDQTLTGSGLISDQTLYRAGFISDQTLYPSVVLCIPESYFEAIKRNPTCINVSSFRTNLYLHFHFIRYV